MNKIISIEWKDKDISLNEWYSSRHWSKRHETAKDWHRFFGILLLEQRLTIPKNVKTYTIAMTYNSQLDPSNTITMIKLLEDTMQKMGIIRGDDKRYCKGISLVPSSKLKGKHYIADIEFS